MIRISLLRFGSRRHPVLRLALGLLGLALLALLSVFALLIASGVLLAWGLRRQWQRLRRPAAEPGQPTRVAAPAEVIEGEFRVVSGARRVLPR